MADKSAEEAKKRAEAIAALVENKDALQQQIADGTFNAKSLSSMLPDAGKDLAAGIAVLVENKDALQQLIETGRFDAKSLSSMLNPEVSKKRPGGKWTDSLGNRTGREPGGPE